MYNISLLGTNMMKATVFAFVMVFVCSTNGESLSKYDLLLQRVDELEARDASSRVDMKEMKTKMAAMETEFSQKMAKMDFELHQWKIGVAGNISTGARRAVAQTKIAFYAIVSQHNVYNIGSGDRVIFDHAYTNLGNAYHPPSGLFIPPIGGTYVISVTISGRKTDGSTSYFTVNVNNAIYAKLLSHTLQQDTNTLILTLRAGDSVSVTTEEGDNGLLGQHYSTFSGFLLYEN